MDAAKAKLQAQRETDQDILAYVRELQKHAPVVEEAIHNFLTTVRRRKIATFETRDRLDYLVSANFLKREKVWNGGEEEQYTVTALGMETMDGAIPPRGWNGKAEG
jgi:hypothetical protein